MKYKGLDLLILHILGKDSPVEDLDSDDSVWAEETVTGSKRQSYLHLCWWLIYPHHFMSEMKTGIHTILF